MALEMVEMKVVWRDGQKAELTVATSVELMALTMVGRTAVSSARWSVGKTVASTVGLKVAPLEMMSVAGMVELTDIQKAA